MVARPRFDAGFAIPVSMTSLARSKYGRSPGRLRGPSSSSPDRRDGVGVGVESGCESQARDAVEVMRRAVRARSEAVAIRPQRSQPGVASDGTQGPDGSSWPCIQRPLATSAPASVSGDRLAALGSLKIGNLPRGNSAHGPIAEALNCRCADGQGVHGNGRSWRWCTACAGPRLDSCGCCDGCPRVR